MKQTIDRNVQNVSKPLHRNKHKIDLNLDTDDLKRDFERTREQTDMVSNDNNGIKRYTPPRMAFYSLIWCMGSTIIFLGNGLIGDFYIDTRISNFRLCM